jgi:maltose alpha-D-glucosyltransferase/alpha-amylase
MSTRRGDAPRPDWAGLAPAALASYLARQRWSGARGARIDGVRVSAVVPFPLAPHGSAPPCAILIVDGLVNGAPTRWQLPLVALPADTPGTAEPVLVRDGLGLFEAVAWAVFRDRLREALAEGATLIGEDAAGGEVRWTARAVGDAPWAREPLPSRVGGAEQSNTSLLYGDSTILKLFRRLESGPQPDVEIGAALAAAHFAHVPALRGVLELQLDGATTVSGMAQALVPAARDAWAVAVDAARAAVAAPDEAAADAALDAAAHMSRRLGAATRALHDALAAVPDEDFAPQRATPADVDRWVAAAGAAFDDALAAVMPSTAEAYETAAFDAARTALESLAERRAELRAHLDGLGASVGEDAGQRIRHHGDYHLGQVLVDAYGDYAIIDFEGEPARPLAERRARHSALRDVAGMLRSFGYAAGAALTGDAVGATHLARGAAWERATRGAFVAGYFAGSHATGDGHVRADYLPASRAHADALLRVFELEKLFYELRYEVRNRPDWLPIPMRGLTALLSDDATASSPSSATAARAG